MKKQPSLILLLAFTLTLISQSCTGLSRSEAPVHEEPDRFVRIEARLGDANPAGAIRFNHPLDLSDREWARILESVWVQHEPGVVALVSPREPAVPAFTSDEIAFLSKMLGKAFRRAHHDEWVVFGLSRRRSPELTEITTGGWYADGGRLYLMLANYRHAVTMSSVRQQLLEDPLHSFGDRYYSFAVGDHQSATLVGGGPLGDLRGTSILQLAVDYTSFLKPPSAAKPAQKPDTSQSVSAPEQGYSSDTAQKLRELKQLRDEGSITEEEYRTKKKQLLDRY